MCEPTDDEIDQWVQEYVAGDDPPWLDDYWFPYWFDPIERDC